MAQDKDLKTPNVPPLRFPGFSDEWMESTIGEVAPLQRGFDLPNQQLEEGEYPVVYSNGIMNHHASYKCKAPGIITGRSGTVGKFTYIDDGYYWPHNTSLWVTGFFDNNPKFIYYLFQTIRIEQYSTGSGVPTLNRNDVHRHKVRIPKSIDEQNKIARLLSILDERIATQNKIIEDLKKLKSAISVQLFEGHNIIGNSNEWKIVSLGDITENFHHRNKNLVSYPMYSVTNTSGFSPQHEVFEGKEIKDEDISIYKIIHKGEFAYNPARINVGSIGRYDEEEPCMISSLYVCFRPTAEVDSDWLLYYLQSAKKIYQYGIFGEGGVRIYLFYPNFSRIEALLPPLKVQKEIASILKFFNRKIKLDELLLSKYQEQKKYLLSNMFI